MTRGAADTSVPPDQRERGRVRERGSVPCRGNVAPLAIGGEIERSVVGVKCTRKVVLMARLT